MLSGLPPFHEPDITPVKLYEKITIGPACIKWPEIHHNAKDLILKVRNSVRREQLTGANPHAYM